MRIGRFNRPRRSFFSVLLLIAAAVVFQMVAPDTDVGRLITVSLQGAVVIASLSAAGADARLMSAAILGTGALLVVAGVSEIGLDNADPAVARLETLALVLVAPIGIATGLRRQLREERRVTLQTVNAGLCLYLLLGLAFAFSFNSIQDLGDEPFFAGGVHGDSNDFLYFSLATLTTTGYGDFTAAGEVGRTFSVVEALAGQIYLVTVVALLVSNLGRTGPGTISAQAAGRVFGQPGSEQPPRE